MWSQRVGHNLGTKQQQYVQKSCQVGLFIFLSSYPIATKIWNNGLKGLKQQTITAQFSSSWQMFLLDSPKTWEQSDPKGHIIMTSLAFSLFILPVSFWLCPVQNRACTHRQFRKGMQLGAHSRLIENCKLCNSRLCCVCAPIIPSVIIRCVYVRMFMNP